MDRVFEEICRKLAENPGLVLVAGIALAGALGLLVSKWRRIQNRRRKHREYLQKAWAEETKRLQSRKQTSSGDGPRPMDESKPVSEQTHLAMPTSTTENLIGIKIAKHLRVVCVSNCESSDLADLRLREMAYKAGAGGIINYKIRVQSDGRFWAEGDSVLLTPSLTNGSTSDHSEEAAAEPVRS